MPADVPTTGPNLLRKDEKPPIEPIAAMKHTPAGAKAFAEFFIKTIDWGYATTSSTYMRHYFNNRCVECRSVSDAISRDRKLGHHYIGGRFHIRDSTTSRAATNNPTITVRFDVSSIEVVTASGGYVGAEPAHNGYREVVSLNWTTGGWQVAGMVPQ